MTASDLRQRTLSVARQWAAAGLRASTGDAGPEVDKIEGFWGLEGLAWCMMFVLFCAMKALAYLQGKADDDATLRAMKAELSERYIEPSPACHEVVDDAKRRGSWKDGTSDLMAGDWVFYCWDGSGKAQHVGIVAGAITDPDRIVSIEGNTTAPDAGGDQAHGHGAYVRIRPLTCVIGRARVGG